MRRLLALLALVTLVIGPPMALLSVGYTDWRSIHLWSLSDVRVLLLVLTVLGWLAWATWLVALVAELVSVLSGRRQRLPTPGLGLPRAVASVLVSAVVAASAASAAEAQPREAPVVVAVETVTPTAVPEFKHEVPGTPPPPHHRHEVQVGDDLWTLAAHHYGDGGQWRLIAEANPDQLSDPLVELTQGSTLTIPVPQGCVVVRAGDTLSALARDHLGEADRWPELFELNRDRISDPDEIDIGWVLRIHPAGDAQASGHRPAEEPTDADAAPPLPEASGSGATEAVVGDPSAEESVVAPSVPGPPGAHDVSTGPGVQEADDVSHGPGGTGPSLAPGALVSRLAPDPDAPPAAALLGGLSAVTAAAVMGGLGVRRHLQAQARPLGRRFASPTGELSRYESALGQVTRSEAPLGRERLLERALRRLSEHWWDEGATPPVLRHLLWGDEDLVLSFEDVPPAVPGFLADGTSLTTTWAALARCPDSDHPVAYPALVTLGRTEGGPMMMVDVMSSGVLGVRAEEGATPDEVLSAMLVELSCAPWASEIDLMVVTGDAAFPMVAGDGRIRCETDPAAGVSAVEGLTRARWPFMAERGWASGRLDPDLASAWTPQVVVFETAPTLAQVARLEVAIGANPCGVAAIVPTTSAAEADWTLSTDAAGARRVTAAGAECTAQTIPAATREALAGLYDLASRTDSEPAPWWGPDAGENDVNIIALRPAPVPEPAETPVRPRLALLGPIELAHCAGDPPTRAVRQCIEYTAWLHLRDGGSPAQMNAELLVADGTRRSNVSRLRAWLGVAPDGTLYLPDGYSGRLELHPDVTSDWEELGLLVTGGVNHQHLDRLVAALDLVRGAPLADAAPGQWGWAEEFRSDAAALIRDIGVVAARQALKRRDLELARWAANRALLAAPEDELLLGERIRTEAAAGRRDEVQRLVTRVARNARSLGVDLLPETVDVCQEVMEGRRRARA